MVEMKLTEATTQKEVKAALAEIYPDQIEFEPGKFAQFDPTIGEWIYHAPDGTQVTISL